MHTQEETSQQRSSNAPRRFVQHQKIFWSIVSSIEKTVVCTLGGHGSIIPGVAFLELQSATKAKLHIANSCFRTWILYFAESNQTSFCVYTLPKISDLGELIFERL